MLFDLFLTTKVSIKIEYPNKILLFIENLCFRSLKIAVCVPKIPIGRRKIKISGASKNYRLKITEWSKNYGLKIPVRVCMRVCMIVGTPPDTRPAHQRNTRPPEKGGTPEKREK